MPQIDTNAPTSGKRTGKVKTAPVEEPAVTADTTPIGEPEVVKVEAAPVEEAPKPDEALQELKRQLDAERAARQQEAQARANAERMAAAAKNETEDTNLRLVENAIETVKANQSGLKAAYAQAAAAGEWDRCADIQENMATNGARLLQLENGKQAMAEAAKRPKEQPKPAIPIPWKPWRPNSRPVPPHGFAPILNMPATRLFMPR